MRYVSSVVLLLPLAFAGPAAQKDESELAKAVNLEKLNTPNDDTDPYPLADGVTLLYASNFNGIFEVNVSRRTGQTQAWPAGKSLITESGADVRTPALYKGFQYFAANPVSDEKFAKLKNYDLFKRVDMGALIPLLGVCEKEDEQRPWITASGAEFFFSRKLKDGWTQFVALGPTPGPIGKAKEVGFPPGFSHGTVSTGGMTMYLQGPLEGKRLGIYRSTRTKVGGAWTKPAPVTKLNHPEGKRGDMAPCLTSDGTRLYFASDRPGGKGGLDIWTVLVSQIK
jgi:hypothetical protein